MIPTKSLYNMFPYFLLEPQYIPYHYHDVVVSIFVSILIYIYIYSIIPCYMRKETQTF